MESIFEPPEHNEKINTFINKFVVCEQIYKIAFCRVKGQKCDKIREDTVEVVFKNLNYSFSKDLLKNIFGSEKHSNKRSAKKLRDLFLHEINSSAIKEITTRYDELIGYMDVFLNGIRLHTEKEKEE